MAVEGNIAGLADRFDLFARSKLACLYDAQRDVLFIFRLGELNRKPAIARDVGGEFWIRQEPSTGEIDDIEIEDFERIFLSKHPQLRPNWLQAKAFVGEGNKPNRAFMSQIVAILQEAVP